MNKTIIFLLTVFTATFSQDIYIQGTVLNDLETPIEGAAVKLLTANLQVSTDIDGSYEFKKISTGIRKHSNISNQPSATDVYDLLGRNIQDKTLPYYFYASPGTSETDPFTLRKMSADVDIIEASADGYITKNVSVANYIDNIDIVLEKYQFSEGITLGMDEDNLKLEWTLTNFSDFDEYRIYMSTEPNVTENSTLVISYTAEAVKEHYLSDLADYTKYYFKIFAYDTYRNKIFSNEINFTTSNLPPKQISLEAVNITENAVSLRWTVCDAPDFANYKLYMSPSQITDVNNATLILTELDAVKNSHVVSGLIDNKVYYFMIYAFDGSGLFTARQINVTTVTSSCGETATIICDQRDEKLYKKVTLGSQTWLAQNLNYTPSSGVYRCSDTDGVNPQTENCDAKGTLVDHETANSDHGNGTDICMEGWHVPSIDDWETLKDFDDDGSKYKSIYGWINNGNGTDEYGFNVLPTVTRLGGVDGAYADFITSYPIADEWSHGAVTFYYVDNRFDIRPSASRHENFVYGVRCVKN